MALHLANLFVTLVIQLTVVLTRVVRNAICLVLLASIIFKLVMQNNVSIARLLILYNYQKLRHALINANLGCTSQLTLHVRCAELHAKGALVQNQTAHLVSLAVS